MFHVASPSKTLLGLVELSSLEAWMICFKTCTHTHMKTKHNKHTSNVGSAKAPKDSLCSLDLRGCSEKAPLLQYVASMESFHRSARLAGMWPSFCLGQRSCPTELRCARFLFLACIGVTSTF